MEQKYRVNELAKDLNAQNNEIIDLVQEYFGTTKKAQTALTDEELSVVLEKYSQKNQVADFKDYYATQSQPKAEEKPAKSEKAEKAEKAEKPAKTTKTTKPKTAKTEVAEKSAKSEKAEKVEKIEKIENIEKAEKVEKIESAPKAEKTEAAPAQSAPKKAEPAKTDAQKPARPMGKPQVFEKPKPNNFNNDRPQTQRRDFQNNQNNQSDRPNNNFRNNNNGNSNYNNNNNSNGGYNNNNNYNRNDRNQQKSAAPKFTPKPVQPVVDVTNIKTNAPPTQHVKGEAVQRGEQVTKHVDTRGSYVNLDKYNERYEKIAPAPNFKANSNDNFSRKQKINQKSQQRRGQYGKKDIRETEAQKLKRLELERARKQQLKVQIPEEIIVSELASRLKVTASDVIKKLFNLGEMCTINQVIDFDTASLVADEFGAKVEKEVVVTIEERLFEEVDDNDENLVPRSPVVVVMGHVDHGKTSLLDRIRNASVAVGEAGGITQHIGAYRVNAGGREITFLDTPGHEAFTSMRARGAMITDIAILVVAADDGIMPQTIEAINHAKAANVSIIVAINKIDKEGANPERIKQELTEHGLVIEEWGGDVICVPVSAKRGDGIDDLLEMVSLTADVLELKANPDRLAKGAVIEARLDKGKGPIATILVQNGTLRVGDAIIAGTAVGRVRTMRDDKGRSVKEAGPAVPVEITGLAEVPSAGDNFAAVEDEKLARELVEKRKYAAKEEQFKLYQKVTLDNLFSQIEQGEMKELPVIVKADVQGSVEAVKQSLEKITNDEVRVRVIHGAVGAVSESDVMLAQASNAIIVGFNVRPHPAAAENAKRDGVDIRLYRIIYDAIEDLTTAMKGMLAPKFREVDTGRVEVRQVMKLTNVGVVAGSYVLDGKVARNGEVRIVRDGIVLAVDKIAGLRRFKDDMKEVSAGYECGISLEKYTDIKEGDIFEAFITEEYRD